MASNHRQQQCYYEKEREVDPAIWRACAGNSIHIPTVHSRVYYFPQGHIEQSSSTVSLSSMAVKHSILCRVLNVSFLADVDTDEVFVKFLLEPLKTAGAGFNFTGNGDGDGGGNGSGGEKEVVSFAKVLTPSDANNGGGFSVPRFCADSIFPPLDFEADPPVQKIRITDIHGDPWEFRHIYRGTPRRHLLTTGWSKFVNGKKLIAGDSVVFMRNKLSNQLFVGIRRAFKMPAVTAGGDSWGFVPKAAQPGMVMSGGAFTRSNRGRVPGEKVVEAVERAVSEVAFEVVYYPRPGLLEFVVEAEKVEMACGVYWRHGMKIKLAQETEDGARLSWFNGTIAKVVGPSNQGLWRGSSWRKLQVDWDEPEILQNLKTVNPWQVEIIAPAPSIHTTPPTKKFKGVQNSGLLTDVEGEPPLPSMGFSSMMGQFGPSFLNFSIFPAGMQGARQNPFLLATRLRTIMNDNHHQAGVLDANVNSSSQKRKAVFTDLNIGSSPSETPYPDSQNSVQLFGVAPTERRCCNLIKKAVTSFQLFGKVIQMEQPLAIVADIGCTENDGSATEGTRDTVENSSSDASKSSVMEVHAL